MYVDVVTGTIVIVMFIMVILWQIVLLFNQQTKQMEMRKDYADFKSSVEGSWKEKMDNIIEQTTELTKAINKLIEHKTNNDN